MRQVALNASCGPGERARERREGRYHIELEDTEPARYPYAPHSLDEFLALPIGTAKTIRVSRDPLRRVAEGRLLGAGGTGAYGAGLTLVRRKT